MAATVSFLKSLLTIDYNVQSAVAAPMGMNLLETTNYLEGEIVRVKEVEGYGRDV